jgi:phospholipase C
MKIAALSLVLWFGNSLAYAQISSFQHVVIIVQENRTPDNLFQGLCSPPYGSSTSCSSTPSAKQYNIQTSNWLDSTATGGTTEPGTVELANDYDLNHGHSGFVAMCDLTGTVCKMDGAAGVNCKAHKGDTCPSKPQFRYVENSKGIMNPYLQMATQYGWANYMFQTNQGPSFPAHQFLFGGTSAPTAKDDAQAIFAAENMASTGGTGGTQVDAGCTAGKKTEVKLIQPPGVESSSTYPCFEHETMGDLFPPQVTWRYYAPSAGSIWTAPNAIQHICVSSGFGGKCTGQDWVDHVDLTSADVLEDIADCHLRSVSWVIPTGYNSDHANDNDGGGPSWVASIVNSIGNSTDCDGKTGYWNNTAIIITWDDWGGWYDHEPPTILPGKQGDYQFGFRVPMIVVSAYTSAGLINNNRHHFGSILRFVEQNYGIQEGAMNFADNRAMTDLTGFFNLTAAPRTFAPITAPLSVDFFRTDKRPATDPDDE